MSLILPFHQLPQRLVELETEDLTRLEQQTQAQIADFSQRITRHLRSYKMYKLTKPNYRGIVECVIRIEDNAFIPFDEFNTDYQAYLKWISEGNTPTPAEE